MTVTEITMSLPVFFPSAQICGSLPRGRRVTLQALCKRAGIKCRVSGPSTKRPLSIGTSPVVKVVREPGHDGAVWIGMPKGTTRRRALLALGTLAYGVFDYAARECLRGLPESRAGVGPGRPRKPGALTAAERQQRHRARRG